MPYLNDEARRRRDMPVRVPEKKDMQRERLYRAEREVFGHRLFHTGWTKAQTLDFLQTVLDTKWFRARWPNAPEVVVETLDAPTEYPSKRSPTTVQQVRRSARLHISWRRGGGGNASPYGPRITFGVTGPNLGPEIAIHELAHIAAPLNAQHDRYFAKTYLMLVERFISVEDARALRKAFVARRVKHTLPKVYTAAGAAVAQERGKALRGLRDKKEPTSL